MEDFLIWLAENANTARFGKAPPGYDLTDQEEQKRLTNDLQNIKNNPILKKFITNVELNMVAHNKASVHPSIKEYEFKYTYLEEFIRDNIHPKRWYMFHGSPLGNWHSILRNGVRNMSNTVMMTTGAILGPGVYMADNLQTAFHYGKSSGKSACIAVLEILEDPTPFHKGNGVYVIPNDTIIVARYLYWLKGCPTDFDGKAALEFYKKLTDARLASKKVPVKRLASEKEELFVVNEHKKYLEVIHENIQYRVYINQFPYRSPVIQLSYKLKPDPKEIFDAKGFYRNSFNWSPAMSIKSALKMIHNSLEETKQHYETTKEEYTLMPFVYVPPPTSPIQPVQPTQSAQSVQSAQSAQPNSTVQPASTVHLASLPYLPSLPSLTPLTPLTHLAPSPI
jgi:hypothetical protein